MPSADPAGALAPSEIEALFAPFAHARRLALAVSGGADSLALMVAVAAWRKAGAGRPDTIVLCVDHGLRASSANEAKMVVDVAARFGMAARMLVWEGAKPESGIEEAAREARYALLIAAARGEGTSHLLTAHHRDDQAETFLMRLSRGSGIFGLGGMRHEIDLGDLTLARPLLDVAKARLVATTRAAGLRPVEDEMNADPRFARARLRALMPSLAAEGLDAKKLVEAADHFRRAGDAIDAVATAALADAVVVDRFGSAVLELDPFLALPDVARVRTLARLVAAVGGLDFMPRGARVQALASAIDSGIDSGAPVRRTLGRTLVRSKGASLTFERESGRGLPCQRPGARFDAPWDGRFRVEVSSEAPDGLEIAALGEADRHAFREGNELPPRAAAATPALRRHGRLIAAPLVGFLPSATDGVKVSVACLVAGRLAEPPRFPGAQPVLFPAVHHESSPG